MKTTNIQSIFILIILTFVSCGTSNSNDKNSENNKEIKGFENFPNSFFLDLKFQEFDKSELKLLNRDFKIENNLFIAKNDSVTIDLNTENKTAIIYLSSSEYLNQTKSMFELFQVKSNRLIGDGQLAEMWYENEGYKLLYFVDPKQIRLEFTQL